jgi:hypothetical protein
MHIGVHVGAAHPVTFTPSGVDYRWDADTDILTAHIRTVAPGTGMSGSVEIEGTDGSWLILDVKGGQIAGVEVAVWPDVKNVGTLAPPTNAARAVISIPARASQPGIASLEVDTQLSAQADAAERTIHFRLGNPRVASAVHVAADLLLELDERHHLVGVWMLNVPPFPSDP